jgi:hypothetical protein
VASTAATPYDGKPIIEDRRVRDLIARDRHIELNTLRRFNQLIYWRTVCQKAHPYGGVRNSGTSENGCAAPMASACKRSWAPMP